MNIIGLQLVLAFFALFMVYVLYLHWKKKNVSNKMFGFWLLIWFCFLIVAFFPKLIEPLMKELFIVRVMDLAMIGAFMILTYVTVENNIKIKKYEDQIEKLVRKIAVKSKKL
jgi:hypothetical protein